MAGCAAGPAPRDHFYRIEVGAPQKLSSPRLKGTLVVDRPKADALTNGRLLLYRAEPGSPEVVQMSYHKWADAPSLLIQDALIEYLRAAGVADQVVSSSTRVEADHVVSGRLLRMERLLGSQPSVSLQLELNLSDGAKRDLLLHRTYREDRPASSGEVADAVSAFDAGLAAIFASFVADLPGS